MKWFGRKAGRETVRPFLMRGFPVGVVGESSAAGASIAAGVPRSYEAQVREAYERNPVAQRAVRLVSEALASAVVVASDGHDAAAALVTAALMETAAMHVLLHGNAYLQILHDDRGEAAELFALRPERVAVEADAGGWPAGYAYRVGEARSRIAAVDGMGRPGLVHVRAAHPLDDHYGLGWLGAAAGAVALHNQATRWNAALLGNAARPSGALVYDGGDGAALTPDQFDRLRSEMEASFSGSGNAGRPMLLEGGLRWQAMSLSPADMDFAGLKATAAREIALAFGVPPVLLGLPGDATYSNYREANRALWRQTVLPLSAKILGGIARALSAWWPGCTLEIDMDRIGELAEERERLWGVVAGADFLSVAEKREMLGFGKSEEAA